MGHGMSHNESSQPQSPPFPPAPSTHRFQPLISHLPLASSVRQHRWNPQPAEAASWLQSDCWRVRWWGKRLHCLSGWQMVWRWDWKMAKRMLCLRALEWLCRTEWAGPWPTCNGPHVWHSRGSAWAARSGGGSRLPGSPSTLTDCLSRLPPPLTQSIRSKAKGTNRQVGMGHGPLERAMCRQSTAKGHAYQMGPGC